MRIEKVPFTRIDWTALPLATRGTMGTAGSRTFERGDVRVRRVDYAPGYVADHWCSRGHVVHVLEGAIETELRDGPRHVLLAGDTYVVSDGEPAHRTRTAGGAKLLIVD